MAALGVGEEDASSAKPLAKRTVPGFQVFDHRRLLPVQPTSHQHEQELKQSCGSQHLQGKDASHFVRTDDNLIKSDTWYHVAVSFGAQGMKLYLNGVLVGTNAYAGGMQGNGEALVIGGSVKTHEGSSSDRSKLRITESFNGYIDEVAFFGAQLAVDELRRVREAGPMALAAAASPGGTASATGRGASIGVTSTLPSLAPPATFSPIEGVVGGAAGRAGTAETGPDEARRRERERSVRIDWNAEPAASKLSAQRAWLGAFLNKGGADPKLNSFLIKLP